MLITRRARGWKLKQTCCNLRCRCTSHMGRKRRVDTHERARVSSYFEVDSYLVFKIFRAPATQTCGYIAMRQIHREIILGKNRREWKQKIERAGWDFCDEVQSSSSWQRARWVWKLRVKALSSMWHEEWPPSRSRNHPLYWTLMDNSARASKVKIPQSIEKKWAKYYNQTYLSKSIIVWANRYIIILEVV